jgi:hypothetical protein
MTKKGTRKREYTKPAVTRITLDAHCAVLGFCKTNATLGPGVPNCGAPFAPCSSPGS